MGRWLIGWLMVEAWIGGNRRVLDPSIHPVKKGEVI